jgi:cobyrinic acid a,c-diamide synthase
VSFFTLRFIYGDVVTHLPKPTKLKLNKKHLGIYNTYEGKKSSLENVGTQKEKELFQNGEFEKITELIQTEYRIKKKELSEKEIQRHKAELNLIFDSNWNKKSLKYLSTKYCEPEKEQRTFDSIMSMLWAMFGQK